MPELKLQDRLMDELDCMFPDCQIKTEFGKACEHSCPYEEQRKQQRAQDALYEETMKTP